jgi:hypothetical protein
MTFSEVEDRGVTASSLIDLMWGLSKKNTELSKRNLLQLTSRDVVDALIKGVTSESRCSFVEWLVKHFGKDADRLMDHSCDYVHTRTLTGTPMTFVSHAWSGKFRDLMYTPLSLGGPRGRMANDCYWIDLFAINQCEKRQEVKREEIKKIRDVVKRCARTVLVLDELALAPTRIWCVFEMWVTITANRPLNIVFASPNGAWTVLYALCILAGRCSKLDVREAEATNPSDKADILAEIESSGVGCDRVNDTVREALHHAARAEVLEKAHVPPDVLDQAVELIRQIGWDNVLQNGPDAQRVIGLFGKHVRYN